MKRGLSDKFISDLLTGSLSGLLEILKRDHTLDLEIRANYINIYYRGGNILKVTEKKPHNYLFHFEKKYFNAAQHNLLCTYDQLIKFCKNENWDSYFPHARQVMDVYFSFHPKAERELQQVILRDNNYSSVANSTDYFIIDIEYDNHKNARFDLVAIEWESTAATRKLPKGYRPKLVVLEFKYGDGAIKGSSGLIKHVKDFKKFNQNPDEIKDFKEEMLKVFEQKRILGLIPCLPRIGLNTNNKSITFQDKIEMIFLIANHDPASSILETELNRLSDKNVHFAVSNFCGYGLYKENIYNYTDFINRFAFQI